MCSLGTELNDKLFAYEASALEQRLASERLNKEVNEIRLERAEEVDAGGMTRGGRWKKMSECKALEQLAVLDDKEATGGGIKEWTKKLKNKLDVESTPHLMPAIHSAGLPVQDF